MQKKILTAFTLLLAAQVGRAQFAQEKVYNYSLTTTRINQTEYKYFLMDVPGAQCRIYNTDHTLWKTIPISLPAGYYLYDIKFVTQNLFNSDATVELWYSAYEWVSTGASDGYYRYVSKVITETGAVLANIPGGAYAYVVAAGSDNYKLLVYAYDNSMTPGAVATYVFGLPNSSSAAGFVAASPEDPYPNPAGDYVNLPLSQGQRGLLQVSSASGQILSEVQTMGERLYRLDTRGWPPGVYAYRMIVNGIPSEAKSFAIH